MEQHGARVASIIILYEDRQREEQGGEGGGVESDW